MKNGPPAKCVCIKIMVHIIIMREKQYIYIDSCLAQKCVNKLPSFAEKPQQIFHYHNYTGTFHMNACDFTLLYMWLAHLT